MHDILLQDKVTLCVLVLAENLPASGGGDNRIETILPAIESAVRGGLATNPNAPVLILGEWLDAKKTESNEQKAE